MRKCFKILLNSMVLIFCFFKPNCEGKETPEKSNSLEMICRSGKNESRCLPGTKTNKKIIYKTCRMQNKKLRIKDCIFTL